MAASMAPTAAEVTERAIDREVRCVTEAIEYVRGREDRRVLIAGLLHGDEVMLRTRSVAQAADVRLLAVPTRDDRTVDIQVEHRTVCG